MVEIQYIIIYIIYFMLYLIYIINTFIHLIYLLTVFTMKSISNIIVEIIKEDMRFNQYIAALRKLGIEVYDFDLDLMSIVADLMEIRREEMTDSWMELYVTELSKCESIPIEPLGKNLYSLAEECFESLKNFNFLKHDNDVGGALS